VKVTPKIFLYSLLIVLAVLGTYRDVFAGSGGHINQVSIVGSINPASANYLIEAIAKSEADGAAALLIELDTPGGLVSSTRDILQAMLNAEVPTIVYVTPRGGWAISAGTFITVAANVAAMSPGTSIGAAHPVSAGGGTQRPADGKDGEPAPSGQPVDVGMEKAENALAAMMESIAQERSRNVEWVVEAVRDSVAVSEVKALELGVIDLVAGNRRELLEAIEGRVVTVLGDERKLELAGLPVVALEMTLLQQIFNFLSDPNVAILLFFAGGLGLYAEFNSPGMIIPGVAGVICMILAAIAFQILPFDWVGVLLIMLGIGLFVAELYVSSFGFLLAAGVLCILLGGTMIFDRPDLSDLTVSFWSVLLPAVSAMVLFGGAIAYAVGRVLFAESIVGVEELVGMVGKSVSPLDPEGKIFVRGEFWDARANEAIAEGESVEIEAVDGMRVRVRRSSAT
jgi:membrane-bound serine protease (ClpP class)